MSKSFPIVRDHNIHEMIGEVKLNTEIAEVDLIEKFLESGMMILTPIVENGKLSHYSIGRKVSNEANGS